MIVNFDVKKDWPFEKLTHRKSYADYKRKDKNTNIFGRWLIGLFEKYSFKVDGKYQIWPNYFMNDKNIEYLRQHIGEWDWLDYSPVSDNSLKDNEIKIKEDICK